MKKLFLFTAMVFGAMVMNAEKHEIGDFVEKDGVPSIVVYVDETGEHGLLLSMSFHRQQTDKQKESTRKSLLDTYKKRYKFYHSKRAKDRGEAEIARIDSMYNVQIQMIDKYLDFAKDDKYYESAVNEKEVKAVHEAVLPHLMGSGKENMEYVLSYCQQNNLSLLDYFPNFCYVHDLGDDWFIPGNDELEILAHTMGVPQVGRDGTYPIYVGHNDKELYDLFDETYKDIKHLLRNVCMGLDYYWFYNWGGDCFWPVMCINSSTAVISDWKNLNNNDDKTAYLETTTYTANYGSAPSLNVSSNTNSNADFYALQWYGAKTKYYQLIFFRNLPGYNCAMAEF